MDRAALYKAMLARDKRFDGRFYIGVRTTGIYCRPVCPARPKEKNVDFYRSSAEAESKGFRPCLRCRPDLSPSSPQFHGTAAVVGRALRLISEGEGESLEKLAARLGLTSRHLRRLFDEHVGASPIEVCGSKRLHHARLLLSQTAMPITEVAFASGFKSLRRFNDAFREKYRKPPRAFRKEGHSPSAGLSIELPVLAPFEWGYLHSFLRAHAIEGLEAFTEDSYARLLPGGGRLHVRWSGEALRLTLEGVDPAGLRPIIARVRRLLDLDHNPAMLRIDNPAMLRIDSPAMLRIDSPATLPRDLGGIRVPGAYRGFETAVFIILGQMVSVAAARGKMARLMELYGEPVKSPWPGLSRLFPSPARLAAADPAALGKGLGITRVRAQALQALAAAVHRRELDLSPSAPLEETRAKLAGLPGVGPWTVEMIAMRCLGDPDAFPARDLIVLRAVEKLKLDHALHAPWRAYLALWIWKNYAAELSGKGKPRPKKKGRK